MAEATLDFITLRQPERVKQRIKRLRYIRDLRSDAQAPFRDQVTRAEAYAEKVIRAQAYVNGLRFFTADRYYALRYEAVVETLREVLIGPITYRDGTRKEGAEIAAIITALEQRVPVLATSGFFHDPTPPPAAVLALFLQYATIWDSLYAVVVLAGIHRVETNYIIDAIRALHLLSLLRLQNLKQPAPTYWPFFDFDSYEALVGDDLLTYTRLI